MEKFCKRMNVISFGLFVILYTIVLIIHFNTGGVNDALLLLPPISLQLWMIGVPMLSWVSMTHERYRPNEHLLTNSSVIVALHMLFAPAIFCIFGFGIMIFEVIYAS